MCHRIFTFLVFLFSSSLAFAEGKLTVTISVEANGKLITDAKIQALSDHDTVILSKTLNDKYVLNLQFGTYYKVKILKNGYLTKKLEVDTRFPTTLRNKDFNLNISLRLFKIYNEINYNEYKNSFIKIKFIGNSSGGYFSYVIKSFQHQQKLDNRLETKIQKLIGGRLIEVEEKIVKLSPKQIELFKKKYKLKVQKEAGGLLASAYKSANNIRLRSRLNAEKEYQRIIEAAKERAKNNESSNLSYIESEESERLIKESKASNKKKQLPDSKEIEEKQRKFNKLANKANKTLQDSINMHIADISLRKDKVSRARYILELMKLRAKTHEDSVLIQQREAEILLAEKAISDTEKALIYANNKIKVQEYEIKNQRIIMIAGFSFLIFVLVFIAFLYRNYKQKSRLNKQLALKNEEITDSIKYAQKIQTVILPELPEMKSVLSDVFVFYKPKDIVSGDFYWFKKQPDKSYFSVVDCTGHGVPGAIVSIIGFDGLERALNEFRLTKPSDILDKLNQIVGSILSKSENANVKDGMDLSLCAYTPETKELEFAGAHNPIYIISENTQSLNIDNNTLKPKLLNGKFALYEIRADRQPIGFYEKPKKFKNHSVKLQKGDRVFLFSDGFPDQFGGKDMQKYKYKNFKKLVLELQPEKLTQQGNILEKTLTEWQGNYEQIDDICVMGVKI